MSEQAIFRPEHVGQVVSHPAFGDGVISNYDQSDNVNAPIDVKFERLNVELSFYADGRYMPGELPTLQFGPLDNWQRRTEPQLKDGDLIEMRLRNTRHWALFQVAIVDGSPCIVESRGDDGEVANTSSLNDREWRFFKP